MAREWWVRNVGGEVRGPMTAQDLHERVRSGQEPPSIEVSHDRLLWATFGLHPDLRAELTPAEAVPPAPLRPGSVRWPFVAVPLLLWAAASWWGSQPQASVHCTVTPVGAMCEIERTRGDREARVCWSAVLVCAGGARVTANACRVVPPHGHIVHGIEEADMHVTGQCEQPEAQSVEDVQVTNL